MIDEATKQLIFDTADIVEVVSDYVTLRKQGANYVGLCPFHNDRRPSFHVSPSKNICKCFACGEGGTPVFFLMKIEKISFTEALRTLARRYHIPIEERQETEEERQKRNLRESLFLAQEFAAKHFQQILSKTDEGLDIAIPYLRQRGVTTQSIDKFGLGYAPNERDSLFQRASAEGYNMRYFYDSGLCYEPDEQHSGGDRFRERIIFPIYTISGRIVGFGGRALRVGEKTAKYINSPETPIYSKSNELYGLFQAKKAIAQKDRCYLVEGYMDVIGMHQVGIENVVAGSGTALTLQQVRLIRRFTKNITILYDADPAGIKATLRGIDLLLEAGMHIKVLLLPDGEDPDSFAKGHSAEEFEQYIAEHEQDFIAFKTNLYRQEMAESPSKKAMIINDILRSVALIPDTIERSLTAQSIASSLKLPEQIVHKEIGAIRRSKYTSSGAYQAQQTRRPITESDKDDTPSLPPLEKPSKNEEELLKLLIRYGELQMCVDNDGEEMMMPLVKFVSECLEAYEVDQIGEVLGIVLNESLQQIEQKENFSPAQYFGNYQDARIAELATTYLSDKYRLSKSAWSALGRYDETAPPSEEELAQQSILLVAGIRIEGINKEIDCYNNTIKELQEKQPEDFESVLQTMKRLQELQALKTEIAKQLGNRTIM